MKKKKWLTQKQYLKNCYSCPVCGSGDINGEGVDIQDGGASQRVSCNKCNAVWVDAYDLTGYIKVTNSDGTQAV